MDAMMSPLAATEPVITLLRTLSAWQIGGKLEKIMMKTNSVEFRAITCAAARFYILQQPQLLIMLIK